MTPAHVDDVERIERLAHFHPWSRSSLRDLDGRGYFHHVLMVNEQLVGYFYAQNIVGEVTLLNIAVDPECQGQGYGKYLMNHLFSLSREQQAESIWLEVRAGNQRAISLYEQNGFHEVDRRRNYYPAAHGREDAIIMSYDFLFH